MEKKLSTIKSGAIECACVDSLQKIFMKREPLQLPEVHTLTAFPGQSVSFQLAYRYTEPYHSYQMQVQGTKNPSVRVMAGIRDPRDPDFFVTAFPDERAKNPSGENLSISVRRVGFVPSAFPAYGESDSGYLTTEPGLFPDPLYDLGADSVIQLIPYYWRSLWIEIRVPEHGGAGKKEIEICFTDLSGRPLVRKNISLQILPLALPESKILHTEWFYADCLADYYHVTVFSEPFWQIVSNFMRTAARRGMNMILTPLFSLPLDTLIGGHRTPVQLVQVRVKRDGSYAFGFEHLDRWVGTAREAGFSWFEMGHLFSQWGARYAPSITASRADGSEQEIFGWNTQASGNAYREFLHAFLPALSAHLRELGIADHTYFHISDEPNEDNIDTYRIAREMVAEDLEGYPILDALSTLKYYAEGLVSHPVPTTEFIGEFLQYGMEHPWIYYCSGEYLKVSNRFFAMPSCRLRILGIQMYLYHIEGFLHWGYNFYNSQYSKRHINPYEVTDADDAFPSGDAFLVYPGEDGRPVESLRLLVLQEAFDDVRILTLMERKTDRKTVEEMIRNIAGMEITFDHYPQSAAFLQEVRQEAIRRIRKAEEL